eukprot:939473-Rhodomonas_salina.2
MCADACDFNGHNVRSHTSGLVLRFILHRPLLSSWAARPSQAICAAGNKQIGKRCVRHGGCRKRLRVRWCPTGRFTASLQVHAGALKDTPPTPSRG